VGVEIFPFIFKFDYMLFTIANTKLLKSKDFGYKSIGLSLLPHRLADEKVDLCGGRSTELCRNYCINVSGHQGLDKIQDNRKKKTLEFLKDRKEFLKKCSIELNYLEQVANNEGLKLTCRMNMFTDIDYFKYKINDKSIYENHNSVQFIEYTKHYNKISILSNLHITYSYDKEYHNEALNVLERGDNLAVIYTNELPNEWNGYKTIDGDKSDLRHLDPKNVVVMLKYKNSMKKGVNNKLLKEQLK
jgi:lipopolysaccharide biosynthesis glycosyltransferase